MAQAIEIGVATMQAYDLFLLVFIYGVGAAVLIYTSGTVLRAGHAASEAPTARRLVWGLWLWSLLATVYALVSGASFAWFGVAFAVPYAIGVAVTFLGPVKNILRQISLTRLVGVQIYRNAGAVFLVTYFFTDSELSREFAMNAGWGDILTGMLAIPVAYAAALRIPAWRWMVVVWCAIGAGDLILAPATALMYGGPAVDGFPLNMIPIFVGPPLGILLHTVTLRALWLQRRAAPVDTSPLRTTPAI